MTPRMRSGQQPSGKSDWETPDDLMAVLRAEFGEFDLDPCATYYTHKAPNYFNLLADRDGLVLSWCKETQWWGISNLSPANVYCNPPYGRNISKWIEKCCLEVKRGNCEIVVALLPVATDTHWWQNWVASATEVRFLKGRVHFKGAAGPAPFASAIVVWRRGMLGWHRVSYWDWKAKL